MEPISLIVTALTAGAVAAVKDTAEKGVKDTYQGLKTLIKLSVSLLMMLWHRQW